MAMAIVEGYAAVFDRAADLGPYVEQVARGAFRRALARRDPVALNVNHNNDLLLASTRRGTLALWEDERGLAFRAELPPTTLAADVVELLRRGDYGGMSFAWAGTRDRWEEAPDGRPLRTLEEVGVQRLFDVAICVHPAYEATEVHLADDAVRRLTPAAAAGARVLPLRRPARPIRLDLAKKRLELARRRLPPAAVIGR
jgi:hypothetical protein